MKLNLLTQMIGKTISGVRRGTVPHYESIEITFDDGDVITLIGGGYDGCGDYIDIHDSSCNDS